MNTQNIDRNDVPTLHCGGDNRDGHDQRDGRTPAPDHQVRDVLSGALTLMALVAVAVYR